MTGLLLKDLLNLKKLMKQYVLILAVMFVWAYLMKNGSFVSMYTVLCSATLVLSSFSYDEYANFEKYAMTMPITRKELVKEKYLLLLLLVGMGTAVGILLGGVLQLFLKENLVELLLTGFVMGCAFLMVYSLVIPVIYKVGVEKARMTMVVIYLGLFVVFYGMLKLIKAGNGLTALKHMEAWIPAGAAAAALVLFIGSFLASLRIIAGKEW